MGRNPIKENQNPYFRARKQAAEWDARLESRERASELIGIAAYTLADYELGNVKRVPADKVLIMADLYNAPWLLSNYCKNECPICGFLPLATEEKNICSVTVRLLKALREDELENMKNQLLEISQDGKIRDDEVEAVRKISEYLDGISDKRYMPKAWRYPAERQPSCGYRSEWRCQFQCNSGKKELSGKRRHRIRSNHDAENAYQSGIFLRSCRS